MRLRDQLFFSWQVIVRHRFRSAMVLVAMSLGVASVVVLTALGEGARQYVLGEFSFLGKDVLVVFPGKKETTGGMPPIMGAAPRDLTLDDIHLLGRRLSSISQMAPLVIGSAEVSYQSRARQVIVLGTNDAMVSLRQLQLSAGRNISSTDIRRVSDECIIGQKLKDELLGAVPVIGAKLRVSDYRCRIVGVLEGRGDSFGMDLSDTLIIPVAAAQRIFNSYGVFRLLVGVKPGYDIDNTKQRLAEVIKDLHQGEEDITVVSPDALLSTFDEVLVVLTLGVAAIGTISLLVAGVLIMNITLINVSQRTEEIGLLKALGASSLDVQRLFLFESVMTVAMGAGIGWLLGYVLVLVGTMLMPTVPFHTPLWAAVAAIVVALLSGLIFSWVPAKRASEMLPLNALQKR
jgi:putative ABC transport system permease protein